MSKAVSRGDLIVGLDIGTSKVVAMVGEVNVDESIEIVGLGTSRSTGLKHGVVVNIEETVTSIQRAIEEAELMAGCQIKEVYAGIAGEHIQSMSSHGIVAVKDGEVFQSDIDRVLDAAQAVPIPANQKILHVLPQEFIIDEQNGIRDPLGMSGVRLEAKVHLVIGAEHVRQNIEKCINRCGLRSESIILEQLASSYAVLTKDEKELGVCMIDMGGGTADIAVFTGGAIRHTATVPVAGDQVTNDIATALRTPTIHAEEIKIKHASALSMLVNDDEMIQVPSIGDRESRSLSRQNLAKVVELRYEEIFNLINENLDHRQHLKNLAGGIVLTGGTSKMKGAVELAEEIFHVPVRVASPHDVKGMKDIITNPIYATAIGLLRYGLKLRLDEYDLHLQYKKQSRPGVINKIIDWFKNQF